MAGVKHDGGKARMDLLPWDAVADVGKIILFGAGKYGDRNWERGIAYSRVWSAAMRHMTAWWQRKPCDDESGLSHLAHAGCNILFLLAYEVRGMGQWDDRPTNTLSYVGVNPLHGWELHDGYGNHLCWAKSLDQGDAVAALEAAGIDPSKWVGHPKHGTSKCSVKGDGT